MNALNFLFFVAGAIYGIFVDGTFLVAEELQKYMNTYVIQ